MSSTTVLRVAAAAAVPLMVSVLGNIIGNTINRLRGWRGTPPRPPRGILLQEMITDAQQALNMNIENYINFAFCGPQNSGKSTLINSLREIDDTGVYNNNELDAARVGETQTTRETRPYGFIEGHELDFVRYWDHAGCGTFDHPTENYFRQNLLYAFDCILLVTASGLGEYERTILEHARRFETDVVIVINKADDRVQSKLRRRPRHLGQPDVNARRLIIQETIDEAKASITEELRNIQQEQVPVFVVSAHKWRDYQFSHSEEDKDLSMEIVPMIEYILNAAFRRRAP
ncbi:unnamed protein product [Adineta ricciae]|uniref:IRG-type G domain-containing protein n=1 Tax=Adineta ricciae TaxID=249248 RepID=A0A815T0U4_ADIRI|nr:unnamed protein product [Adineta ricciae]CAF1494984.1 unnamed protein product [Adineta ricciae]